MKIRILYFNILDYCERLWNVFMINYQAPLNLINRRSAEFDNDHITEEFSKSEKIWSDESGRYKKYTKMKENQTLTLLLLFIGN